MIHLCTEISKYIMIILFAVYTYYSYAVLKVRNEERQKRIYKSQTTCMFLIHLDAYVVLLAADPGLEILIFCGARVAFVLLLFLRSRTLVFCSKIRYTGLKSYWMNQPAGTAPGRQTDCNGGSVCAR